VCSSFVAVVAEEFCILKHVNVIVIPEQIQGNPPLIMTQLDASTVTLTRHGSPTPPHPNPLWTNRYEVPRTDCSVPGHCPCKHTSHKLSSDFSTFLDLRRGKYKDTCSGRSTWSGGERRKPIGPTEDSLAPRILILSTQMREMPDGGRDC
jgi:hypothetical protein